MDHRAPSVNTRTMLNTSIVFACCCVKYEYVYTLIANNQVTFLMHTL